MRLLNAETHRFEVFPSVHARPPYAILSHTWGDNELSFQQFSQASDVTDGIDDYKIKSACEQTIQNGLQYIWIDTICIDKTSSTELSEAINLMFKWYEESVVCFAYLFDVSPGEDRSNHMSSRFETCRWFTRGWTLQELLAPRKVKFFASDWSYVASRGELADQIQTITGIDKMYLEDTFDNAGRHNSMLRASIAERMSWASRRVTTRVEDTAYCLLGLFNVNMSLIYGEGHQAFQRLQEEILKFSFDPTLLAWDAQIECEDTPGTFKEMPLRGSWSSAARALGGLDHPWFLDPLGESHKESSSQSFLALAPTQFEGCGNIIAMDVDTAWSQTTNGLEVMLPKSKDAVPHILLPCHRKDDPWRLLAVPIARHSRGLSSRATSGLKWIDASRWELWPSKPLILATRASQSNHAAMESLTYGFYVDKSQRFKVLQVHNGTKWETFAAFKRIREFPSLGSSPKASYISLLVEDLDTLLQFAVFVPNQTADIRPNSLIWKIRISLCPGSQCHCITMDTRQSVDRLLMKGDEISSLPGYCFLQGSPVEVRVHRRCVAGNPILRLTINAHVSPTRGLMMKYSTTAVSIYRNIMAMTVPTTIPILNAVKALVKRQMIREEILPKLLAIILAISPPIMHDLGQTAGFRLRKYSCSEQAAPIVSFPTRQVRKLRLGDDQSLVEYVTAVEIWHGLLPQLLWFHPDLSNFVEEHHWKLAFAIGYSSIYVLPRSVSTLLLFFYWFITVGTTLENATHRLPFIGHPEGVSSLTFLALVAAGEWFQYVLVLHDMPCEGPPIYSLGNRGVWFVLEEVAITVFDMVREGIWETRLRNPALFLTTVLVLALCLVGFIRDPMRFCLRLCTIAIFSIVLLRKVY